MKIQKITLAILFFCNMTYAQKSTKYELKNQKATRIVTAKEEENKMQNLGDLSFYQFPQPKETDVCIFIDPTHKYQKLVGIGGAITDASAEVLYKMPKNKQEEILNAYYNPQSGIGYNLVRTNMNSCDFSSDMYTYVKDNDEELKSFNIEHDEKYKIPMIKEAQKRIGKDFTLYFSPWSPPAWMKDTNNRLKGGSLLPKYYQSWANYYVKYIKALEDRGLPVFGFSIQNEPMATQTWESCIYTAEQERDFLKKNLGPTMWKNGYKDKKIIIWDHNRDLIFQRASVLLNDSEAAKYAWGIGYHWYETWTKSSQLYENIEETQKAFPDKALIFTEGCKEKFDYSKISDWSLGELYGENIINDFNNGTVAWTDWNVLLDETGGPNHVGNFCFAPIIANTKTGEVHYTNEFYYIGHFSKYIKPQAERVSSSTNRDYLLATSFLNTNNELVVVVMNKSEQPTTYNLWIQGKATKATAAPHSIETLIIK